MILQTYQSMAVLKILHSGEIYRAKPSISYRGEYNALIELLSLKCDCPVFCVVKGRKQNTSGRVSGKVRLTLDVPDKHIKLTEFSVWADFLEAFRYVDPRDSEKISTASDAISQRDYDALKEELRHQKKLSEYNYPQAILEKINPAWLKSYKIIPGNSPLSGEKIERFRNYFRK